MLNALKEEFTLVQNRALALLWKN